MIVLESILQNVAVGDEVDWLFSALPYFAVQHNWIVEIDGTSFFLHVFDCHALSESCEVGCVRSFLIA